MKKIYIQRSLENPKIILKSFKIKIKKYFPQKENSFYIYPEEQIFIY